MMIDKLRQIATKTGDEGNSKNYNNESYKKSDILFEALGTIDELSSYLGLVYHSTKLEKIKDIQVILQNINSILATNPDSDIYNKINKVSEDDIHWVEKEIQLLLDIKPLEPKFTLPGSEKTIEGAHFDFARTLARKAERRLNEFSDKHSRKDLKSTKKYLNRLSDYLYVLSCNY